MIHENEFVKAFIDSGSQRRCLSLLSSPKGRIKFRKLLAHFDALRQDKIATVPLNSQSPKGIYELLITQGAPENSYFMCEWAQYDSLELPINKGLSILYNLGIGYIISCIPGKLAFYQGEISGHQLILINKVA